MILVRTRPSIFLPVMMAIWGALTCCMAAINDYHHLLVLRLFVGVFEASFAPGILMIISSWYKKTEQSARFAVYISAAILSGAFGGLLAGAITGGLEGAGGLRGWRWLFIVEGVRYFTSPKRKMSTDQSQAATIVWACCSAFILLDFPATTKRLTERERTIATARLRNTRVLVPTEGQVKIGKRQSFLAAVSNWRTWGFIVGYMVRLAPYAASSDNPDLCTIGDRWQFHTLILLPDIGQGFGLHRPCPSSIHDGADLCSSVRLHSDNRLLLRQDPGLARYCHCWLADSITDHIDCGLHCVRLHRTICHVGDHGCWPLGC